MKRQSPRASDARAADKHASAAPRAGMVSKQPGTPINIIKGTGHRYRSLLQRHDGVCVELVAGGYNHVGGPAGRVPHDLAHFIVEDELQLGYGLWGLLAAGALFSPANTRVISGRQPPHAARKSRAILECAGDRPMQAEVVVRAVADLAVSGRHRDTAAFHAALGSRWALPAITPDCLAATCRRLQESGAQWDILAPHQAISVFWTFPEPRK